MINVVVGIQINGCHTVRECCTDSEYSDLLCCAVAVLVIACMTAKSDVLAIGNILVVVAAAK